MKRFYLAGLVIIIILGGLFFYKQQVAAPSSNTKQTAATPAVGFNKNKYSLSDPTSIWIVANKKRPLTPIDYVPKDLTNLEGGQTMRKEAAQALTKMFAEAKTTKIILTADSGFRSYAKQKVIYNAFVAKDSQANADTYSARPGYSEHQTGLAMDVGQGVCHIDPCFANMPGGQWLVANAYKYGFIIRYQEDKQAVTGYHYEPWHIRYVGVELATEMHKTGVTTLEEFFGLGAAPSY